MYDWLDKFSQVDHGPDARFLDDVTFEALVRANYPGEDTEAVADLLCWMFFGVGGDGVSSLYVLEHLKNRGGLRKIFPVVTAHRRRRTFALAGKKVCLSIRLFLCKLGCVSILGRRRL